MYVMRLEDVHTYLSINKHKIYQFLYLIYIIVDFLYVKYLW
jgi:hypothetical protein